MKHEHNETNYFCFQCCSESYSKTNMMVASKTHYLAINLWKGERNINMVVNSCSMFKYRIFQYVAAIGCKFIRVFIYVVFFFIYTSNQYLGQYFKYVSFIYINSITVCIRTKTHLVEFPNIIVNFQIKCCLVTAWKWR